MMCVHTGAFAHLTEKSLELLDVAGLCRLERSKRVRMQHH